MEVGIQYVVYIVARPNGEYIGKGAWMRMSTPSLTSSFIPPHLLTLRNLQRASRNPNNLNHRGSFSHFKLNHTGAGTNLLPNADHRKDMNISESDLSESDHTNTSQKTNGFGNGAGVKEMQ